MTLAAEKEFKHIGETMGCADHDHDLIQDLSKRLDALVAVRPIHRQRRGQAVDSSSVAQAEEAGAGQRQGNQGLDRRGDQGQVLLGTARRVVAQRRTCLFAIVRSIELRHSRTRS